MNKYQVALERLKINHKDIYQELNCDVLQEALEELEELKRIPTSEQV